MPITLSFGRSTILARFPRQISILEKLYYLFKVLMASKLALDTDMYPPLVCIYLFFLALME